MENHSCRLRKIQTQIKIGLLGHGKMGKTIERLALEKGHLISTLDDADVLIDFSHPSVVLENIQKAIDLKKNIVIGTTGWDEHLSQIKQKIALADIGCIYSPNFSVGIHIFLKIVEEAAQLIDVFDEYDISGLEAHHNKKVDIPSGTALALGDRLLKKLKRKNTITYGTSNFIGDESSIHFPSLRSGNMPGMHSVIFDSEADTITLKHEARNRDSFARGAILSAEWIKNKRGFFTFDEVMDQHG